MKFKTILGSITLTSERRTHIIQHHPIMGNYIKHLKEVLESPNEVRYSSRSNEVLLFYKFFSKIEGGKYVVGVVNKTDKQVKTAYLTHRIKIGEEYEEN